MNTSYKYLAHILFIVLAFSVNNISYADEMNYSDLLEKIGSEIEELREYYPQLCKFTPAKHVQVESLRISYEYKTHEPTHRGGWRAGVPHPDPDGIWFRAGPRQLMGKGPIR